MINFVPIDVTRICTFRNVNKDFSAKIPVITFVAGTNIVVGEYQTVGNIAMHCELSLNNHNAFQTSQLIADYCVLDPRVRILGVCLRHWARLCKVN